MINSKYEKTSLNNLQLTSFTRSEILELIRLSIMDAANYSAIGKSLSSPLIELLNQVEHQQLTAELALKRLNQLMKQEDFLPEFAFDEIRQQVQWARHGENIQNDLMIECSRQAERMLMLAQQYIRKHELSSKPENEIDALIHQLRKEAVQFSDKHEDRWNTLFVLSLILPIALFVCAIAILTTALSLAAYGYFTSAMIYGLSETVALNCTIAGGLTVAALFSAIPTLGILLRDYVVNHRHEALKQDLTEKTAVIAIPAPVNFATIPVTLFSQEKPHVSLTTVTIESQQKSNLLEQFSKISLTAKIGG